VAGLLCAAALLASCDSQPQAEATEVSCADTVRDPQTDLTCYTVAVPEDHAKPDGDTMELFVVVVDNPEGEEIGPVAYLAGGPGDAAHNAVSSMRRQPLDVVLVDQRGTGLSEPSLRCPEVDEIAPSLLSLGHTAETDGLVAAALADCGARLASEGVDVSLFDTDSNARDFEIVRTALGYDEWNLWGESYGSRLGLEILRLHPENVRAAVFSEVVDPAADLAAEWPDHFRNSLDLLVEGCAASPDCHDAFSDIGSVLTGLVEELDAEPVDVEVFGYTVRMDGAALADTVRDALHTSGNIRRLPLLLNSAAEGNLVPLAEIRADQRKPAPAISWGMYWSVYCRDYYSVTDQEAMAAALADETGAFTRLSTYTWFTGTCAQWGAGTSPSSTREPVISDVPTLLLSGTFDPGTPPVWAQQVAQGLTDSTYIEFARSGHDASSLPCGLMAIEHFLRDPSETPDIPCDPSEPPRWLVP
jgi:pimeloyl-ACP methyl ester carboxylesterase